MPATKISIVCFYLRIFPQEQLRIWSYGLIAANILYFLAFEIITVFQCTPIEGAWLMWDGEFATTCRDVNLQAWVAAAVCIVLDVATIALPMPELWKLNLSWKKKAQVMLMFAVGLLYVARDLFPCMPLDLMLIWAQCDHRVCPPPAFSFALCENAERHS